MLQSLEFCGLNDDEIKRIMSVIERDFKLRQKESKRLEDLKKTIRQEHERVEYLSSSKEFNHSRCIRCFKQFKIFFNPKEFCSQCQLNVCHECSTFNKQTKLWMCKLCLKLKELESLTADWFYTETGKKYRRCGSAKIVRELYKREKQFPEIDEDLGYGTLQKSPSTDSKDSAISYVVHDRNLAGELNEYSARLKYLLENLHFDLSPRNKRKVNLKDYQQQITSEISRARMVLSGPLRRSNRKLNVYEVDLQNLLIQKTEEILRTSLQEFQRNSIISNFDQKLAQIILNKYTKQKGPQKSQQQLSMSGNRELKSRNDSLQELNSSRTPAVDEEDTEKEEDNDDEQERTPTENKMDDRNHRSIDTNLATMQKSTERVVDWKTNCTLIESKNVSSDNDEPEIYNTWF